MNHRFLIGFIGVILFAIVSFTAVVPVTLHYYGIGNIFVIKATIGLLCLLAGYIMIWAFLKSEYSVKQKKTGKLHTRPFMILCGIVIVALAWFTALPLYLADMTGLSQTFEYGTDTLTGGIGTRLWTSALTAFGVLLVRFGFYRDAQPKRAHSETEYNQLLNTGRQEGYYD